MATEAASPLLDGAVVRSDVLSGEAEAAAIKTKAAWGNVDMVATLPTYPPIDVSNSWLGVLIFWLWSFPLVGAFIVIPYVVPAYPWALAVLFAPLTIAIVCAYVPTMLRALFYAGQIYVQLNLPAKQASESCLAWVYRGVLSTLLIPIMHTALISGLLILVVRSKSKRGVTWDILNAAWGGRHAYVFGEGVYWMGYEKVNELLASDQRRGPYMGASILEVPGNAPHDFLLFLDGHQHKAVRSSLRLGCSTPRCTTRAPPAYQKSLHRCSGRAPLSMPWSLQMARSTRPSFRSSWHAVSTT